MKNLQRSRVLAPLFPRHRIFMGLFSRRSQDLKQNRITEFRREVSPMSTPQVDQNMRNISEFLSVAGIRYGSFKIFMFLTISVEKRVYWEKLMSRNDYVRKF
jgi:hypothetical protein